MNIEEFDQCFKKARIYWKRSERAKHWNEYREIYHQELGQFPPIALTEALDDCISSCQYFPDIYEVKRSLQNRASKYSEEGVGRQLDTSLHIQAERILDDRFGHRFEGYQARPMPAHVLTWLDEAEEQGRRTAELVEDVDAMDVARNALFMKFARG